MSIMREKVGKICVINIDFLILQKKYILQELWRHIFVDPLPHHHILPDLPFPDMNAPSLNFQISFSRPRYFF